MFKSDAIRGTETVIRPALMLVRKVTDVNCMITIKA